MFFSLYFSLCNNNNKTKEKQIHDNHFHIPAIWLLLFSCFHCRIVQRNVEKWASPQKWSYEDGRAALCVRPALNKTDPRDEEVFCHLILTMCNHSYTVPAPKKVYWTDPYLLESRISAELLWRVVFSFDQIFESIGQMRPVVLTLDSWLYLRIDPFLYFGPAKKTLVHGVPWRQLGGNFLVLRHWWKCKSSHQ